eukprot:TRINITY_DN279_c0_g1_i3.p2 TRINITY_DN279_c0_g1~~TRINITY_DN279_c0_g1_i3.p2  ORF type:complete len:101 (-),score=17.51 TRINITY_DN279_c0_g1_i3:1155-1457(-)
MNIPDHGLIIICGLQGGGKSHVIRHIMHTKRKKFDWGVVFSNTIFCEGNYDYIDPDFVYPKYNDDVIIGLKRKIEELKMQKKNPASFVLFDDCLGKAQWN